MSWISRLLPWMVLTVIIAIGVMTIATVILSICLPKPQTSSPAAITADNLTIDELIQREARLKRNIFLGIVAVLAILVTASVMWGQIDIQT